MKNIIKVLFVIIATLIGAGFASGKEIYLFFFMYGIKGVIGFVVSSFIISYVIYKVFNICINRNINNYNDFCKCIGSEFLNKIVNIFLLITFCIMISGFASFVQQEFNINKVYASFIIIIICYITLLKNINGLVVVSNLLIPIIISFIFIISIKNINIIENYKYVLNEIEIIRNGAIIKGILYSSYNSILLIPVLTTLVKFVKNKKQIKIISVVNFILLIALIGLVFNILLVGNKYIYSLEMPIIEIVKNYGNIYSYVYILIIAIAIYTTAISTEYSFLNNCKSNVNKKLYKRNLKVVSVLALVISQISFSFLVNLLYPVFGVVGIIEIYLIIKKMY